MSLAKRAAVGLAARDGRVQFSTHVIGIRGDGDLYVILLPVERGVGIDALLLVQEAVGGLDAVFCNHVPYYKVYIIFAISIAKIRKIFECCYTFKLLWSKIDA